MRCSSVVPNPQPFVPFTTAPETPALIKIYQALYRAFGPRHWWPAETPFEVIVGAILTQNTAWKNVEKAITNLKSAGLLELYRLNRLPRQKMASLIRPAGYYNIKAKRLRALTEWLETNGGLERVKRFSTPKLRTQLLDIYGVGPETADSILLYAFNRPVFVVDAYTRRIFSRYGLISGNEPYEQLRIWLEQQLVPLTGKSRARAVAIFNEYHALLVHLGKTYCRPQPICSGCPLESV
ncbi:endonuclease III domain-containing protein [candidate division WOR-3 bacterium]|nr:endonuclease III domain-containing protein [candidate division WOR-3 bacterium]